MTGADQSDATPQPDAQPKPQETTSAGFTMKWPRIRIAAIAAAALFLGVAAFTWFAVSPAIGPSLFSHETYGRIYVESPEVYTRERLVNDRYDQHYWLRSQLERLDKSDQLFSESRFEAFEIWYNEKAGAPSGSPTEIKSPPFEREFELRSAMRDRIRQMVLENLLDDRHDLTGNSVYGLKFDTSVIPGANTRADAMVRVTLKLPEFPNGNDRLVALGDDDTSSEARKRRLAHHFASWVSNVEIRLNDYVRKTTSPCMERRAPARADLPEAPPPPPPQSFLTAIESVLSLDSRRASWGSRSDASHWYYSVTLPDPWRSYFLINLRVEKACPKRPLIDLEPVFSSLWIVDKKDWVAFEKIMQQTKEKHKAEDPEQYACNIEKKFLSISEISIENSEAQDGVPEGEVKNSRAEYKTIVTHFYDSDYLTQEQYTSLQPDVDIGPEELEALLKVGQNICALPRFKVGEDGDYCPLKTGDAEKSASALSEDNCALSGRLVYIPTGLMNFIDALSNHDAYTYAAFPRLDVTGVLTKATLQAASEINIPGVGEPGVRGSSATQAAEAIPTLIGFSESPCENRTGNAAQNGCGQDQTAPTSVTFGWIITSNRRVTPIQKSQLVLVSVPAYLDELDIEVETTWLDDEGDAIEETRRTYDMPIVRVPPDFEAIDTLVGNEQSRHGPAIFGDRYFFAGEISLQACEPAEIIVPGARLWRSATVTVGSQAADRITVLPNMQGLLASFDKINIPTTSSAAIAETGARVLTDKDAAIVHETGGGTAVSETEAARPAGLSSSSRIVKVPLSVWTSEGVDTQHDRVAVVVPTAGVCAAPGGGGATR